MGRYCIVVRKKVLKHLEKLPKNIIQRFAALAEDLAESGPYRSNWPNYSKLGGKKYHCHLNRSYVACWEYEKDEITIEVYYVGSRENAPY